MLSHDKDMHVARTMRAQFNRLFDVGGARRAGYEIERGGHASVRSKNCDDILETRQNGGTHGNYEFAAWPKMPRRGAMWPGEEYECAGLRDGVIGGGERAR